ncbi:energy-coupling factor ABC transporter ATP-binding protein [Carnobacteriaceae bacterium zg-84]|uniref:energy-coupling factor ABC transporter ATP-binding protein n=1 Tax=Granulicatella sp. zg-84 TaxID=2678503 RepID=UPI0013C2425B|nr:energy-coupling factor ABC transporter ATP-binding protein [Granulicatella sp. zg-84]NEW65665.1 energy-coupling factor ABC transporter ATP-binding protein [Granulicatella sp. zg-84]QMI85694.1 energy-coupling factor ABC transporter ATP-binding protein [Carnobacteriaceae bacterium zg-84]
MIVVENLSYAYKKEDGTKEHQALDNVSFHVKKGEWVAIVGHNGSGKSTLAKLLNGLLVADSGKICIDKTELSQETIWDIRQGMGMVFQNPDNQFVGATVEDDVAFGLENQGVPREDMQQRVEEALALVGMSDYKDKEPARLSGGQKQRVAIAGVLALHPNIIILDEATAMLDPKGRKRVIDVVQSLRQTLDMTVLSITHDVEEASLADRLFVMNGGCLLYEGTPADIFGTVTDIETLGLELPFAEKVKRALAENGIRVPEQYMTLQELEEWVCRLLLNK